MAGKFKYSPVLMVVAVLATFVLVSTVLSGEHPWDTDRSTHSTGGSGGTGTPDSSSMAATDSARSVRVVGSSTAESSTSVVEYLRRIVFQIARNYGEWYRSSGSSSTHSSRW